MMTKDDLQEQFPLLCQVNPDISFEERLAGDLGIVEMLCSLLGVRFDEGLKSGAWLSAIDAKLEKAVSNSSKKLWCVYQPIECKYEPTWEDKSMDIEASTQEEAIAKYLLKYPLLNGAELECVLCSTTFIVKDGKAVRSKG